MDAAEIERLLDAPATRAAPTADMTGPVTVLASESGPDGATRVDIQASRLVPLDPDDPAMADVSMPVPTPATVVVDGAGRLDAVETKPLDDEVERQARAFARNLVANGAVRGLAASGPVAARAAEPADARGRASMREGARSSGGSGSPPTLDPKAQHGPTSHHETGGTKDA